MKKSDLYGLGLVVAALVALGLVVLSSASETNAFKYHHDSWAFVKRQFAYLTAALALAFGVARMNYRNWRDRPWMTIALCAVVFALLWVVFAFPAVKGSHRWISLGPVRMQPGEFAKLAVVIAVAVYMDRIGWRVDYFTRGLIVPGLIIGTFAVPIILEPDFGSVMVVGLAGGLVMFIAGTKILHFLPFIVVGAGGFAFKLATNANRMARIKAFLGMDVALESNPAGDQALQSLIAFKNGGLYGVGLGQSLQKKLYLPEAHTDFIFAIGAEELGIFFTVAVVLLFAAFLFFAVRIALRADDRFGRYLVIGMSFIVFYQAMFNLGVVCEALPTKGMALPFFSYGGTNLICTFLAVGTIFSVGLHSGRDQKRWRR